MKKYFFCAIIISLFTFIQGRIPFILAAEKLMHTSLRT